MMPEEMIEVTEEEFQANFDNYMDLIENHGAHYLIVVRMVRQS